MTTRDPRTNKQQAVHLLPSPSTSKTTPPSLRQLRTKGRRHRSLCPFSTPPSSNKTPSRARCSKANATFVATVDAVVAERDVPLLHQVPGEYLALRRPCEWSCEWPCERPSKGVRARRCRDPSAAAEAAAAVEHNADDDVRL